MRRGLPVSGLGSHQTHLLDDIRVRGNGRLEQLVQGLHVLGLGKSALGYTIDAQTHVHDGRGIYGANEVRKPRRRVVLKESEASKESGLIERLLRCSRLSTKLWKYFGGPLGSSGEKLPLVAPACGRGRLTAMTSSHAWTTSQRKQSYPSVQTASSPPHRPAAASAVSCAQLSMVLLDN